MGKVLIERVFRVRVEGLTSEVGFGKLRPSYRGRGRGQCGGGDAEGKVEASQA